MCEQLGAVHKRRLHTIAKNSLPSCPLNVHTGSTVNPPFCPCRHTINFEKSEFFAPKSTDVRIWRTPSPLVHKMSHWTTSLTADVFYGRLLTPPPRTKQVTTVAGRLSVVMLLDPFWEIGMQKKLPRRPIDAFCLQWIVATLFWLDTARAVINGHVRFLCSIECFNDRKKRYCFYLCLLHPSGIINFFCFVKDVQINSEKGWQKSFVVYSKWYAN